MPDKPPRKKSVNLSIDASLAAEAKEFGTNMSAVLEIALREQLKAEKAERWRKDNQKALDAYDEHIGKEGHWLDEFRNW